MKTVAERREVGAEHAPPLELGVTRVMCVAAVTGGKRTPAGTS